MTPSDLTTTSNSASQRVSSTPTALPVEHTRVDVSTLDKQGFLEEILKSRRELQIARQQFEQVADPLLIDHVVFRIGAAERHLNYLFKLAREQGISFDGMQWEWQQHAWKVD